MRYKPWKGEHVVIRCYCSKCREWIDESTIEFVDISEDFEGVDILTFICPTCKTEQSSRRIS